MSSHPVCCVAVVCTWQALLFVPVIYTMIGFSMVAEKAFYYGILFLASISFYTIFGQFMVYVTPSQQIAQVSYKYSGAAAVIQRACGAEALLAFRQAAIHVQRLTVFTSIELEIL
jgi:hypothetical protein